ncbi:MAG: DUF5107 domain-containing protein, partial [Vicinamibacteraceae bacterium]
LRPVRDVPLFEWARPAEVKIWSALLKVFEAKGAPPDPPPVHENHWAPSGMGDLGPALEWASESAEGDDADLWRFHHGAWLAGTGNTEEVIRVLATCENGVGKALLARLLEARGDLRAAANAYAGIRERWVQLHPQVVVERDRLLRRMGQETLAERERWLNSVAALSDEWIRERQVQLLIDKGEVPEAKQLLLATRFQKVHQTYTRTNLWMQICKRLKEPCYPIPEVLGEDRLARFGAYREFER